MNDLSPMEAQALEVSRTVDPMMTMIERVVMSPDADINKLERMLAMKERMDAQAAGMAFAAALSAARADIPPIIKNAAVDFGRGRASYRYETLADIAKAIDPVLARHGLSYRYRTGQSGNTVTVTCIVSHVAGHSEETSLSCSPDASGNKNIIQAVGSAVTYLQRYTLKAALGLSAAGDDDGNGAAPRPDDGRSVSTAMIEADALINAMRRASSVEEIKEIWQAEAGTRRRIAEADRAQYERVKAAAAARKDELTSEPLAGEVVDIPYEGPST